MLDLDFLCHPLVHLFDSSEVFLIELPSVVFSSFMKMLADLRCLGVEAFSVSCLKSNFFASV